MLTQRDYSSRHRTYGDLKILSSYLGYKNTPIVTQGELPHGWIIKERNIIPDFVIGSDGLGYKKKNGRLFVSRKDQEVYLESEGFTDVHAIGHPITYIDPLPNYKRRKNSLLIMPAHSLPETTEDWQQVDIAYAQFLAQNISYFSYVAICLHPEDVKKNNWAKVKELAPDIIEGADLKDANSYKRMAQMFSEFEYVTTNSMGSHVAYGSYFGAKVSVCGPSHFRKQDYTGLFFFKNQPAILDVLEDWHKSSSMQKWYPQFFCSPIEATSNIEWAQWQLGLGCRKTKKDLVKLLGWGATAQFLILAKTLMIKIIKKIFLLKSRIVHVYNLFRSFGLDSFSAFLALKEAEKKRGLGLITSKKIIIHFRNRSTDKDVIWQHFGRRELLDIHYPNNTRNILDLGSNIGVSVIAFRNLFPVANIIAVEMNSENFQLLQENCSSDPKIELVNAAIWSENGYVNQVDVGDGEWALRVGSYEGKPLGKVPSYTFEKILEMHRLNGVDVCKMDIEGAESDVLRKSWKVIFSKTKLLILEIHDWIPNCAESVNSVIVKAQKVFNLSISYSGEFTLIENLDL